MKNAIVIVFCCAALLALSSPTHAKVKPTTRTGAITTFVVALPVQGKEQRTLVLPWPKPLSKAPGNLTNLTWKTERETGGTGVFSVKSAVPASWDKGTPLKLVMDISPPSQASSAEAFLTLYASKSPNGLPQKILSARVAAKFIPRPKFECSATEEHILAIQSRPVAQVPIECKNVGGERATLSDFQATCPSAPKSTWSFPASSTVAPGDSVSLSVPVTLLPKPDAAQNHNCTIAFLANGVQPDMTPLHTDIRLVEFPFLLEKLLGKGSLNMNAKGLYSYAFEPTTEGGEAKVDIRFKPLPGFQLKAIRVKKAPEESFVLAPGMLSKDSIHIVSKPKDGRFPKDAVSILEVTYQDDRKNLNTEPIPLLLSATEMQVLKRQQDWQRASMYVLPGNPELALSRDQIYVESMRERETQRDPSAPPHWWFSWKEGPTTYSEKQFFEKAGKIYDDSLRNLARLWFFPEKMVGRMEIVEQHSDFLQIRTSVPTVLVAQPRLKQVAVQAEALTAVGFLNAFSNFVGMGARVAAMYQVDMFSNQIPGYGGQDSQRTGSFVRGYGDGAVSFGVDFTAIKGVYAKPNDIAGDMEMGPLLLRLGGFLSIQSFGNRLGGAWDIGLSWQHVSSYSVQFPRSKPPVERPPRVMEASNGVFGFVGGTFFVRPVERMKNFHISIGAKVGYVFRADDDGGYLAGEFPIGVLLRF